MKMKPSVNKTGKKLVFAAILLMTIFPAIASAVIPGISGTTFDFVARIGYIVTPDGGSYLMWGYANTDVNGTGTMQYPGPTIIVNQGDMITINLKSELPQNTSMVFPGQSDVNATGGIKGLITRDAPANGVTTVTYKFTAANPGTYIYHSGTRPELQIEMGLVGAIIVRPTGYDPDTNKKAYAHDDSLYDHEYLFLLTEMDPTIHLAMEICDMTSVDNTTYWPVNWFINGRAAPDTMLPAGHPLLPNQPYNCLPRMRPGEKMLLRLIGGGRDSHPYHTHGNNFIRIARDAKLLESATDAGADLAVSDFTQTVMPGATYDAIFEWTGEKLGWDIYGHDVNDPLQPNEYAPDHGKPFPVTLPEQKDLMFGAFYSGSPFLGAVSPLPPGEGGLNINAGFFYMWHSHNEKEMVNNDIFPGGIMTMLIVEPPDVNIP